MRPQPRHELKHEISHGDYEALRRRLAPVMAHDPHTGPDGLYAIHSLYFDNFADAALREKLDGAPAREKFRIRYYNDDLAVIRLEKKCKLRGLTTKYSAPLTEAEVRALLAGDTGWMRSSEHGLVRELYTKMQTELLRPRQTVDYIREPFTYGPGNVRVTFDRAVSAGPADERFLAPHTDVPADVRGLVILEVKYDRFLPGHLAALLQLGDRPRQSYSKYEKCRTFY